MVRLLSLFFRLVVSRTDILEKVWTCHREHQCDRGEERQYRSRWGRTRWQSWSFWINSFRDRCHKWCGRRRCTVGGIIIVLIILIIIIIIVLTIGGDTIMITIRGLVCGSWCTTLMTGDNRLGMKNIGLRCTTSPFDIQTRQQGSWNWKQST